MGGAARCHCRAGPGVGRGWHGAAAGCGTRRGCYCIRARWYCYWRTTKMAMGIQRFVGAPAPRRSASIAAVTAAPRAYLALTVCIAVGGSYCRRRRITCFPPSRLVRSPAAGGETLDELLDVSRWSRKETFDLKAFGRTAAGWFPWGARAWLFCRRRRVA